jgi:hypothetical protein
MKIFDVSELLEQAIREAEEKGTNPETGELADGWDEFIEFFQDTRDHSALQMARWIKNMEAEAEAIEAEAKKLMDRSKALYKRAAGTRNWLSRFVKPGEKLSDACSLISWRKSSAVEINVPVEQLLPEYVRTKITQDADKVAIKEAIKNGVEIPGCVIVDKLNLQIK